MIVFHNRRYNIDLGLLNRIHPFDGTKFEKVLRGIDGAGVEVRDVPRPVAMSMVDEFVSENLGVLLRGKRYVLQALEVPYLPLVPFRWIDRKVLESMRWGVAGTLAAANHALSGVHCWNLSGGYHHASRHAAEGFCLYNDIGITVQQMRKSGALAADDRILIIDVDAHHGNGNGHVFKDDPRVEILDIYTGDIYPFSPSTKKRVDIDLPLPSFTSGIDYLSVLGEGLQRLSGPARLAFVIAGTDVLDTDPLGRQALSVDQCVLRDGLVLDALDRLATPAVVVGGGGYGKDSAIAMTKSVLAHRAR
jgi:histone deacetylase 11